MAKAVFILAKFTQQVSMKMFAITPQPSLPWPPWVTRHKIETILFVLHHPGKPRYQGKQGWLFCNVILLTFLPTKFTNVDEPLRCLQLRSTPTPTATPTFKTPHIKSKDY
jgi:hypothetical protein